MLFHFRLGIRGGALIHHVSKCSAFLERLRDTFEDALMGGALDDALVGNPQALPGIIDVGEIGQVEGLTDLAADEITWGARVFTQSRAVLVAAFSPDARGLEQIWGALHRVWQASGDELVVEHVSSSSTLLRHLETGEWVEDA